MAIMPKMNINTPYTVAVRSEEVKSHIVNPTANPSVAVRERHNALFIRSSLQKSFHFHSP